MDENVFARSVEVGLSLSKRVRNTEDAPPLKPPRPMAKMEKSASSVTPELCLPSSPMVYAMVSDPAIVDNPDVPSYQPYVHGRCNPPALVPLQMYGVEVEVDCYLDTAFVAVSGSWKLQCVMGNKSCDCCLAIVMGEQARTSHGTILSLGVDLVGLLQCTGCCVCRKMI